MEVPKNLLNANSPQKQLQADGRKMLPEGEKKSGGWLMFIIGFVIGAALMWVFSGTRGSDSVEVKDDLNTAEISTSTSMIDDTEVSGSELTADVSASLNTASSASSENTAISSGTDFVTVKGQLAGMKIDIESLDVTSSTWVAIHEERNGGLGNILGARRFEPGRKSGVVELLRATAPNTIYHAVMYRDNGDGEFSKTLDTKLSNANGALIESVFKTE